MHYFFFAEEEIRIRDIPDPLRTKYNELKRAHEKLQIRMHETVCNNVVFRQKIEELKEMISGKPPTPPPPPYSSLSF